MKIAIIGAGISGLAAGRFLDELGHHVELFEATPLFTAGLLESRNIDGYVFDVGGGHIIYTTDTWLSSFIEGLYDDEALVLHQRNTKIFYKGKFVKYPFENGLSDLPPEVNYECLLGFIRSHMKRSYVEEPDNFKDWIFYRMGEGIARHFMIPYNEKIWNSNLEELGVDWVSGRVPEAPLEDILRSSLGIATEGYTHQAAFSYPLRGGIHDLAKRVGQPILQKIHFGHPVQHIERRGPGRYDVDGAEFERVVYTAPLDKASRIVAGLDDESALAGEALQHISLTSFLFGLDGEEARPYSWVYLPFPEEGPANRLTYFSNYSPYNAPEGKASILVEVTHRGPLNVGDSYIKALRKHLHSAGFIKEDRVHVEAHGTIDYAYLFFDKDFTRKRALAVQGLENLGIHPLGRFGRFNYFNMDHCILDAKTLAEKIHEDQG